MCQYKIIKFNYILLILILLIGNIYSGGYNWPLGYDKYQEKPLSSTFMEYRSIPNFHYHGGIDMLPLNSSPSEWMFYSVVNGYVDNWGNLGTTEEYLNVGGFTYIHTTKNPQLFIGAWVPVDGYLGDVNPNLTNPHLHFEEGGVWYGYRYNPLDCFYGIDPYTDTNNPIIQDITFFRDGTSTTLNNGNINNNVDIRVNCYDPFDNPNNPNNPYHAGVYELAYQLRTTTGQECGLPNWNIRFDYWTTNSGFDIVWHSDDSIWVSNFLDPNTGQSSDEYWNSAEIRNGDFRMYIIATDLSCSPHQVEYFENITINNPAQVKTNNIQNTSEIWQGEVLVRGQYDPTYGRNVLRVINSYLEFAAWSRITIESNVWLIIENNSILWQDPDAEVILQPGAEIIYENGARGTIASDIEFQGTGSCFYNKGQLTLSANVNLNVENGGLVVIDGGEFILENNAGVIFESNSQKLDIKPGSTIRLGDGAEIVVKSYIDAQGTEQDSIRFTYLNQGQGPSGYWKWLKIEGSEFGSGEANMGIIKYAAIENADYGIYCYQVPNLAIENSTSRNCWVNNLYLNTSSADIDSNLIANSSSDGVWLYNSSPEFFYNTIRNNQNAGVYCDYYRSPSFGSNTTTDHGFNVIKDNVYGIYANYYSNPFLGDEYVVEGPAVFAGYNSIYNNEMAAVKAVQKCDIPAQYNWWGSYPVEPSIFDIDESSMLDYSNALTSDPNGGALAMKGSGLTFSKQGNPSLPLENFTPRQLLRLAKQLRLKNTPRLAIPVYQRLVRNYTSRAEARWGIIELITTYKEAKLDSAVAYLQYLKTVQIHPLITRLAGDLLTGEQLKSGDVTRAVNNAQEMLANYPNTESEKMALFDLVNIYLHNLNDTTQAQTYLVQLESTYPNDELTMHAQLLLNGGSGMMTKGVRINTPVNMTKPSTQIPETFALMQNYPNPFNPTTTIAFAIPEAQTVKLTIYSLSGQEIITLANGFVEKGFHQIEWNGKDASDRQVASGIYLYRLKAGNNNLVKKMMLIK